MAQIPVFDPGAMTQYLGCDGVPVRDVPLWAHDVEPLLRAYEWMMLTRMFDQKAVALQRTGQLGTFPSSVGQEAIGVACGLALEAQDVFVPYYRDHATQLIRGAAMQDLLLYWGGDERGSYAGPAQDLPVCVPIATQCGHAVGAAAALKIRHQPQAVLCTLGDGATSKGDFSEALNLAGTWHLPVVFVINNNQWAISVPRAAQCGAPTLAQKGWGAGIHSVQADGNDIIAMLEVVNEALDRARHRKGPTLIEAISYRLGDHTTADDASRYRAADDVQAAWEREPLLRLRRFLTSQGAWSEAMDARWQEHCQALISKAVEQYLATPPQAAEAMFDHLYAEWPAALDEQLDLFAARMAVREV
ncbi:MAG: pyruvate dehydrogenase (acetyl-transferring) E1 component subunit alpha [Saccharospirillaceae bacterium]|nr:pyruvate dehydrogenase (acetyl-transferring) E1 component subunit alpha [Saccharospirillaceae bacterium]MCD8532610.1 pyruvate dehydrogenase (acetyl-transferring) E1 component subunit alpha [Saccharospirillaceae bacterium]